MMQPKLRFPTFQDMWERTPLSKLMNFNNGINASKESYGHGRKFINVLDILNNNYVLYDDIIGSVNVNAKQEETNKVEYGDVLFLRSSETRIDVGKSTVYLDHDEYALFGGFVIRGKKMGDYNPFFLKLLLDTSSARNQISSKAGGSTRYNVSQSILSSVELLMPLISEQQKIADFFILLNRRIEKQQEKVEAVREYKKGMMQKLFSRELRFKDGKVFPEWEEKEVKNFGSVLTGNTPAKNESSYWNQGNIPWITPTDIGNNRDMRHSSTMLSSKGYEKSRKIPGNSLLVTCIASIGKNAILRADGSCNQQINAIVPNQDYNVEFLYYLIEENVAKIRNMAGKTATEIVNKTTFEGIRFFVPKLPEQKEIAILLSLIDKKNDAEVKKLELYQEQKKAFMQKMYI